MPVKKTFVWKDGKFETKDGDRDEFYKNLPPLDLSDAKTAHIGWVKPWFCAALPRGQQWIHGKSDFIHKATEHHLAVEENHGPTAKRANLQALGLGVR